VRRTAEIAEIVFCNVIASMLYFSSVFINCSHSCNLCMQWWVQLTKKLASMTDNSLTRKLA